MNAASGRSQQVVADWISVFTWGREQSVALSHCAIALESCAMTRLQFPLSGPFFVYKNFDFLCRLTPMHVCAGAAPSADAPLLLLLPPPLLPLGRLRRRMWRNRKLSCRLILHGNLFHAATHIRRSHCCRRIVPQRPTRSAPRTPSPTSCRTSTPTLWLRLSTATERPIQKAIAPIMSNEKVPKPRLLRRRKELNEIEQIQARAPPPPLSCPPPLSHLLATGAHPAASPSARQQPPSLRQV